MARRGTLSGIAQPTSTTGGRSLTRQPYCLGPETNYTAPRCACELVAAREWGQYEALYLIVTALAVGERARAFKAISPGMLPPLAIIFALLLAFLASQVWSDADRASMAVNREASALRAVVLLAAEFPGQPEASLRELIRLHIQDAVTQEWPAMARRNATLAIAPPRLTEALRLTLSLNSQSPGQVTAQREMVVSVENALERFS